MCSPDTLPLCVCVCVCVSLYSPPHFTVAVYCFPRPCLLIEGAQFGSVATFYFPWVHFHESQ